MKFGFSGPVTPCGWRCINEIGVIGAVAARINVPILRGDDERVLVQIVRDEVCDLFGKGVAALNR